MNRVERYNRWKAQPEYLKTWLMGISEYQQAHVILTSENFAIVQFDGHSWYRNAFCGMTYAKTKWTLISKNTRNYWHNRGIEIKEGGKFSKAVKKEFEELLKKKEDEKKRVP